MLRYFFLIFGFIVILVVAMAGFRGQKTSNRPLEIFPDMDSQPKKKAQVPSDFFADGRAGRDPVEGTVPLGYSMPQQSEAPAGQAGPYYAIQFTGGPGYEQTGKMGDQFGTGIPVEVTADVMARGQQRFNIYCATCHGSTGAGDGFAKQLGLGTVQSLLQERIRDMADGEIFDTITHGKNTMFALGANIQVPDRWAIIAYLRALQRSQETTTADVPEEELVKLKAIP